MLTPLPVANRPGLTALAYRVGTHPSFLATMLARLSSLELGGPDGVRPLEKLTTRAGTDPTIALLDAWAIVADVLTFYQERIANEGYLRTATEYRSVLELARLVGYRARPGVAASVYLAFSLEQGARVEIPAGTRAQSVPAGAGEAAQSFETLAPFWGDFEWNAMHPRQHRPQLITDDLDELYLEGTATNLRPNDPIVLDGPGRRQAYRVRAVEPRAQPDRPDRTRVALAPWRPIAEELGVVDVGVPGVEVARIERLGVERLGARRDEDIGQLVTATAQAVRDLILRYSNLRLFSARFPGALARRVLARLSELDEQMKAYVEGPDESAEAAVERLLEQLGDAADALRADLAEAERQGYSMQPWLTKILARIQELLEPLREFLEKTLSLGEDDSLLGRVVTALGKPRSIPPASPADLPRDIPSTFAATSSFGLELATALKPGIGRTLRRAWATAPAAPPAEVEAVEAPRIEAAPFGASAPLELILDHTGRPLGQREWSLGPALELTVEVAPSGSDANGDSTASVKLYLRRHGELHDGEATVSFESSNERVTLGSSEAVVSLSVETQRPSVTVDLTLSDGRTLELEVEPGPSELTVTLDGSSAVLTPARDEDEDEDEGEGVSGQRFLIGDTWLDLERRGRIIAVRLSAPDSAPLSERRTLALDSIRPGIARGSLVIVDRPPRESAPTPILTRVLSVREAGRARYGIAAQVTVLELATDWLSDDDFTLAVARDTRVYAAPDALPLADKPIDPVADPVTGATIELDGLYDGLEVGRHVIVSGEWLLGEGDQSLAAIEGVPAAEVAMVAAVHHRPQTVPGDRNHTVILLAEPLAYAYRRDTAIVHGNVAEATHGETRAEILGSGDGSEQHQEFALSYDPLTYLPAATPAGAESTLEVRVDGVRWREARQAATLGPDDRAYVVRVEQDGSTSVLFGDGRHGTRLPTGIDNVEATYRQGLGASGNVHADQISQLATRPLGLRGVTNPLPATGGADPDDRDDIRRNAPVAVTALDRLVSPRDYADFARTFAGIAKASARRLSDGQREVVHLTLAGADDEPIDPGSRLLDRLERALRDHGDPHQALELAARRLRLLIIKAGVGVAADHRWREVEARIRAALVHALGFDRRAFGQDVTASEVIALIQSVRGVSWVDLDVLDAVGDAEIQRGLDGLIERLEGSQPWQRVRAGLARPGAGGLVPAELVYLHPDLPKTLILEERTS